MQRAAPHGGCVLLRQRTHLVADSFLIRGKCKTLAARLVICGVVDFLSTLSLLVDDERISDIYLQRAWRRPKLDRKLRHGLER